MKKIVLTLLFITTIFAQDIVSIVTSGDGPTKDQATTAALRNAIEQAYGAFISSNTKFLNDELIQDEITSVAQGNINSYEILNTTSTPNGFSVLVKSELSLKKLEQFGQSFGQKVRVNSNVIYMNAVKEDFYEKNEYQSILDYVHSYKDVQFFDYSLEYKNPYRDGDSWIYPIKIKITSNKNLSKFYNGLYDLVEDISISYKTKRYREDLNLGTYEMNYAKLPRKNAIAVFAKPRYLRNESSLNYLNDSGEYGYILDASGDDFGTKYFDKFIVPQYSNAKMLNWSIHPCYKKIKSRGYLYGKCISGYELNYSTSKNNGEIQRHRLITSLGNNLDSFIVTKIYDFDFFYNSFEDLIPIKILGRDGFKEKKRDGISGLKPPIIEYFYNDLSISINLSFSAEEFKNITGFEIIPRN